MLAFAVQYGLYHRLLRKALRSNEPGLVMSALKRWLKIAIAWQLLVLGGCALYLVVLNSGHARGVAWISPAIGAAFGTALPLQLVVMAIMRSARTR